MKFMRLVHYALIASIAAVHLDATPLVRPQSTADALRSPGGEERLTGSAAVAHLEKLQARQKHLARAAAHLRERGYTTTDDVTVIQSRHHVRNRSSHGSSNIHPVQERVSDGSGEIVFWSWDDGNSATWEGVIYVENYATGATATWNTQMDVSTEDFQVLWEQQVGGSSGRGDQQMTSLPDPRGREAAIQVASTSLAATSGSLRDTSDFVLVQSAPSAQKWLGCMLAQGCPRSRMCVFLGPGCLAISCAGGAISCALVEMM